jgi:hypothetical protein
MRGKYSPTVTAAYMADQHWWSLYAAKCKEWTQYDPEGYDSYGYNVNGEDRAGNQEYVYYENNANWDGGDYNWRYDQALDEWGFDGTKPVLKNPPKAREPYAWEVTHKGSKYSEFMSAESFKTRIFAADVFTFKPLFE